MSGYGRFQPFQRGVTLQKLLNQVQPILSDHKGPTEEVPTWPPQLSRG